MSSSRSVVEVLILALFLSMQSYIKSTVSINEMFVRRGVKSTEHRTIHAIYVCCLANKTENVFYAVGGQAGSKEHRNYGQSSS